MFSRESPVPAMINSMSGPADVIMALVGLVLGLGAIFAAFFFTGTDWVTAILITLTLLVVIGLGGVGALLISIFFALLLKLGAGLVASLLTTVTKLEVFVELNKIIEGTSSPQLALAFFIIGVILTTLRSYIVGFWREN